MVLIMGLATQKIGWHEDLCNMLADRGLRVIRFDNRDVGLSSKLDHLGTPPLRMLVVRGMMRMPAPPPYTLDDMAGDVVGLLDALGVDSAHMVGASMGGMIAQLLAIGHPDRVRSLTSIMSHPGDFLSKLARPKALRALITPVPREREAAVNHLVEVMRTLAGPGYPFDEARIRDYIERARARSFHPRGFLRQVAAIMAAPSRISALRSVTTPALVLHGRDDPLVPAVGGRATARAIPGARLRLFPGMGHDLPEPLWPTFADAIANHVFAAEASAAPDDAQRASG